MRRKRFPIYAMVIKFPVGSLAMGEIRRIQLQLSHLAENNLRTVSTSAQLRASEDRIRKMCADCKRQMAAQRITSPQAACRRAKYNGEVIDLGIIYPFAGCCGEKSDGYTHHYS